jgi:hypothetical protein
MPPFQSSETHSSPQKQSSGHKRGKHPYNRELLIHLLAVWHEVFWQVLSLKCWGTQLWTVVETVMITVYAV